MSHYSTEKRLVALLCELACDVTPESCVVRTLTIPLGMTQTQIAELLGVTRESVCKVLASFQKRELIEVRSQTIHILDPQELFSTQYGNVITNSNSAE